MVQNNSKQALLKLLYERSFRYDSAKGFVLASGTKSDIYVDVKKTVLSPPGGELTGRVLYDMIKDDPIDGIGGLTLGADPLAYATALISSMEGKPLSVFIVRKESKKHGTRRWVEGSLEEGARVVVVDDVVTTGGSTIKAIERAREAGLEVKRVIALVDRSEGGKENIEKECGLPLEGVFQRKDFIDLHEADR
ncbi:MAG: orotate phosphoribosyltransferase [Thermodesulfobacteriota bacterium]